MEPRARGIQHHLVALATEIEALAGRFGASEEIHSTDARVLLESEAPLKSAVRREREEQAQPAVDADHRQTNGPQDP